jgi:hypothetical protein
MRRLAALLLIAAAGWMLWQLAGRFGGLTERSIVEMLERELGNPSFLLPALGGVLAFCGGVIALLGGVGGAAIAIIGGVITVGFAVYVGQPFWTGDWHVWNSEAMVGAAILVLAGLTAILGRD